MKHERAVRLLKKGADVAGSSTGAAVGALVGGGLAGPPGAIAGAAIGKVCEIVLVDVADRMLSQREQVKVGGVAAIAIDEIQDRLHWESPREDGFFCREVAGEPSAGEELFEGILLAAKQEHEQKKLSYIARFYSNLVFKAYFQPAEANHLLSIAESLTYQQFCILALIAKRDEFELRATGWPEKGTIPASNLDLAMQALYLYQRQLLISIDPQSGEVGYVMDIVWVLPSHCHLSPSGHRLVEILDLGRIQGDELQKVATNL